VELYEKELLALRSSRHTLDSIVRVSEVIAVIPKDLLESGTDADGWSEAPRASPRGIPPKAGKPGEGE